MATEVLQSFGTLQLELEEARTSLKDVDEHIKKLIGRDPSENQQRSTQKRPGNHPDESRGRVRVHNNNFQNNRNKQNYENDEPSGKKRNLDSSVFKRLSDRPKHFDEEIPEGFGKNQVISKVIVTPKELPSRQEVLAAQGADEKSKARNRRMFGALLGTLQKFRQEETKQKSKEEKRAQVEKKLEEQQIKEREELKKERQDLFFNRKRKQAEIRMIELKMTRMKEHAEWEEKQKPLMNFIQTKSKPHIYYLPKILNEKNTELLEANRQNIEKMIDRKRQDVYEELYTIEQRMKRNFSNKQSHNDSLIMTNELGEPEDIEMQEIEMESEPINQIKVEVEHTLPEINEIELPIIESEIEETQWEETVEKVVEETTVVEGPKLKLKPENDKDYEENDKKDDKEDDSEDDKEKEKEKKKEDDKEEDKEEDKVEDKVEDKKEDKEKYEENDKVEDREDDKEEDKVENEGKDKDKEIKKPVDKEVKTETRQTDSKPDEEHTS